MLIKNLIKNIKLYDEKKYWIGIGVSRILDILIYYPIIIINLKIII